MATALKGQHVGICVSGNELSVLGRLWSRALLTLAPGLWEARRRPFEILLCIVPRW